MYHYTQKMNGKKYTMATWTGDPQSSLRLAEAVFTKHGMKNGEAEFERVTKQAMYKGEHASYDGSKFFTETLREATTYFHNELIYDYVQMKGSTEAMKYLLDLWQDDTEALEDVRNYFKNS